MKSEHFVLFMLAFYCDTELKFYQGNPDRYDKGLTDGYDYCYGILASLYETADSEIVEGLLREWEEQLKHLWNRKDVYAQGKAYALEDVIKRLRNCEYHFYETLIYVN